MSVTITAVMDYCRNHFLRSMESQEMVFSASAKTITGEFGEDYLAGQYVFVRGTILNDGAYTISNVAESGDDIVLTVTEDVLDETTANTDVVPYLFGLRVPAAFIGLVADISTWDTANASKAGVQAERIDDYSITYATGADGSQAIWTHAFGARLAQYMSVFDDIEEATGYAY